MSPNTDDPTLAMEIEALLPEDAATTSTPPSDPTLVTAATGSTSRQHTVLVLRPAPNAHAQSFQVSSSQAGLMTRSSTETETEPDHDTEIATTGTNTTPLLAPRAHEQTETPAQTPLLTPAEVLTQRGNVHQALVRNLQFLQRERHFYADTIENIRDRVQREVEKFQRGGPEEQEEAEEAIRLLVERVNYHREMFDRMLRQERVVERELERRRAEMAREH